MNYTPSQFHELLMALSGLFGFRVSSYYRSPWANQQVGGVPDSLHQLWLAADVVLDDMADLNKTNFTRGAERLGLLVVDEEDHLHVQLSRRSF